MIELLNFIRNPKDSDSYNSVLKDWMNSITILDLGCGLGSRWFDLFYELDFKRIIGIDKYSQQELIDYDGIFTENSISCYKMYLRYVNKNHKENIKILTETEYDQTFVFKKNDIKNIFMSDFFTENSFDLIIAYQILYLFNRNEAKEIINGIKVRMKKGAYLYIYLASEDFTESKFRPLNAPEEKRVKFSLNESELKSMIEPLSVIDSDKKGQYRYILCQKK